MLSAFVPLSSIVELVNIGTLFAFILVNIGVILLRRTKPDMERPFRVPFSPVFPLIGVAFCVYLCPGPAGRDLDPVRGLDGGRTGDLRRSTATATPASANARPRPAGRAEVAGDRLIVGYDGGPTGADALTFGRRWGSAAGTTPVVVTVHPGQTPLGPGRTDAEWNAYQREEAEALLAEARALLGDGAEYRSVDASSPAHGLSDLVEAGDCVLVLGARRARGLRRTYPGSNAQRLLHGSASPVTIVPSDYAEREDTGLRRVTVAYLDTPDGQAALSAGARFARQLGADLEVLTVVPDTRRHAGEPSRFGTEQRADYQQALDRAVAAVDGVRATGRLVDGPVVDTLVDIEADQTDVLVCGSRDYGPVARVLLGGVSGRVVRHSRVPVTVVPRAR